LKPEDFIVKSLRRLQRSLKKRALFRKYGEAWKRKESGFLNRTYNSYEDYLAHQKSKLELHDFGDYDAKFREALRVRLVALDLIWEGRTALCLAARIGSEVKAFLDLGCFAVGIDLNPGKQNPYVLYGDFHNLQFASHSVDFVFTNSLDHAFDVERMAKEILRVLRPTGLLIVEALQGANKGAKPGFFESFWWNSIDELARVFEDAGFQLKKRTAIAYPWGGEMLCLQPRSSTSA
jgi:SAM-dependent methyltransferase